MDDSQAVDPPVGVRHGATVDREPFQEHGAKDDGNPGELSRNQDRRAVKNSVAMLDFRYRLLLQKYG
ncbi:MAG: hypothetical protein M0Q40_11605 [Limnochordia bacterium]|nr:hypothetical protein [Limnochordia bacterium]MDD4518541.1 hypothetical protein [Limnochordia bacterium]